MVSSPGRQAAFVSHHTIQPRYQSSIPGRWAEKTRCPSLSVALTDSTEFFLRDCRGLPDRCQKLGGLTVHAPAYGKGGGSTPKGATLKDQGLPPQAVPTQSRSITEKRGSPPPALVQYPGVLPMGEVDRSTKCPAALPEAPECIWNGECTIPCQEVCQKERRSW